MPDSDRGDLSGSFHATGHEPGTLGRVPAAELGRTLAVAGSPAAAKACGLSVRSLRRKVRSGGETLRALRDAWRRASVEAAFRSGDSVKEAAARAGFSCPEVLSRFCRRLYGTSPSAVRKRVLSGA